jgi:Holliday junction resolvase RusA-like endonuclease
VRLGHAKKWHKLVARFAAIKPTKPLPRAQIILVRATSRRPDFDGLVGSFKHVIDGLTEARIILDDSHECIGIPDYKWEKTSPKNSHIRVTVTEVSDAQPDK